MPGWDDSLLSDISVRVGQSETIYLPFVCSGDTSQKILINLMETTLENDGPVYPYETMFKYERLSYTLTVSPVSDSQIGTHKYRLTGEGYLLDGYIGDVTIRV